MEFASVPSTISYNEVLQRNDFCISPSKYSQVNTTNSNFVKFETLSNLVKLRKPKKQVFNDKTVIYIEIGDININTGSIEYKKIPLYKLPKSNIKVFNGDILISKVRTYRGGIGIVNNNDTKSIFSTSALIVIKDVMNIDKSYLYAILRSKYFIEQIKTFENRGMYPRLDNDTINNVKIPIPHDITIIDKISILTQSLIKKEVELREKFDQIKILIENELKENQLSNKFNYQMLSYNDLVEFNRFDTGLYTQKIKKVEFLIQNYKYGSQTIVEQGFYSVRGQNLQVSQIGKSIYTNNLKQGFYQLFLPTHISLYGTINKVLFIGNAKTLLQVQNDDIIFGAEGFGKGRSFIPLNENGRFITNIHGTMLRHDNEMIYKKIFIKCMIDWFREKNLIDAYSVGGNGGSFSTKYWKVLKFPLFPKDKQKDIAKLYYNPSDDYVAHIVNFDIKNYINIDKKVTENSGILDLDKQIKIIRDAIDIEIKKIVE